MPAIPTPTITADLCIKTKWGTRKSRLFYEPETLPTDEIQLGACATAIFTKFGDKIIEVLPDEHQFVAVECVFYGPGGEGFVANSSQDPLDGSLSTPDENTPESDGAGDSEDILPDECALIIQRRTGKRGRSKYGRLYIGGLSEKIQYAGEISSAYRAECVAIATAVPQDIAVAGAFTSVLHARHWDRKNNVMEPVTKAYAVNGIGSRRDRRRPTPMSRL